MDCHAGTYDLDILGAKRGDGLAESVVLIWIIRIEEGDLHDRYIDRVCLWIEQNTKASPDTMVKTTLRRLSIDARVVQEGDNVACHSRGATMWELCFIVVRWETVEIVDEIGLLGSIDFDGITRGLPVGREDDNSFRFDLLGDFAADLYKLGVDWVGCVVHDIGLQLN